MLTRIEIDGFKTFREFAIDALPFQVVLGPNAVGKSNLFDALHLLSRLAEHDLYTAFQELRGEPSEMFSLVGSGKTVDRMSFAVEVLVDPETHDQWGQPVVVKHSRMRYELALERRKGDNGGDRLFVVREGVFPIQDKSDRWAKSAARTFRDAYVRRGRRTPWLETKDKGGAPSFRILQDGRQGRSRPADAAQSTNLSGFMSDEFPHLFALREELRSWRFLQLNPEGLRRPSPTLSSSRLTHDGSNLASVLARLKNDTATAERPRGIIADVSSTLMSLVPGVRSLNVVEDEKKSEYRVDITMQDGNCFPSRVLSDGTLRILALVALMHDPKEGGLICFEEPENGVHPFRLAQMIDTLRNLVTDLRDDDPDPAEPLKQVLLNSHSPVVLNALKDGEMLFADIVTRVSQASDSPSTRCTRLRRCDRALFESGPDHVTHEFVRRYLEMATLSEESVQ